MDISGNAPATSRIRRDKDGAGTEEAMQTGDLQ